MLHSAQYLHMNILHMLYLSHLLHISHKYHTNRFAQILFLSAIATFRLLYLIIPSLINNSASSIFI